jgi:periplasmic divalent cation tolerance protein
MSKYLQVVTTFDNEEEANRVINILVDNRLVSCCQLSNIVSTYHWNGKKEHNNEYMVFMKTKEELYKEVEKTILENHSYEVPEIIAYPIMYGSDSYLNWIEKETKRVD